MMSKHSLDSRKHETSVSLESLVLKNHLVRKIDRALNFQFIYPLIESTCSAS